jgi:hypothetical protein
LRPTPIDEQIGAYLRAVQVRRFFFRFTVAPVFSSFLFVEHGL